MPPAFEFVESDRKEVAAAIHFARQLLAYDGLTPADIFGLARAIYALQRLPEATDGIQLDFCTSMERGDDENKEEWGWMVRISPTAFSISSGGSVWSKWAGGDSVSGYLYEIEAGGYRDMNGPVSSWSNDIEMRLAQPFRVFVHDDSTLTVFAE
jgi:hypothetical protein